MAWCSMNTKYVLETLKIVAKDIVKKYTSIGTNKTPGTFLPAPSPIQPEL